VTVVFRFDHRAVPISSVAGATFEIIANLEQLAAADRAVLVEYGGDDEIVDFERSFACGETCAVGRYENQLASVCWVSRRTGHHFAKNDASVVLLYRCFTIPKHRGKGLYPFVLQSSCRSLLTSENGPRDILVESSLFNQASIRGIQHAGFVPVGREYRVLGMRWRRRLHPG
jgi:hypothetical protein